MSGIANDGGVGSAGVGFLDPLNMSGLKQGPKSNVNNANAGLGDLNDQNSAVSGNSPIASWSQDALSQYANGQLNSGQLMDGSSAMDAGQHQGFINQLATDPRTGTKFATEQVQNNPILSGLFGDKGALNTAEGKLNDLQNQGFELKPEDMTLYGQTSGNIARMFGAQGNQISQDLANRGLASAPSGAAGAMFSGLAGNQNEQLAQAQQQIMQQRFQNTMNQIGQQQQFIGQLGQQGENAINQQYARNQSGVQGQTAGLTGAAQANTMQNQEANSATLGANKFAADNKPMGMSDYGQVFGTAAASSAGKGVGQGASAAAMA